VASQLALGLSDMLRFMIYECNQPVVPLSKELKMISDYITLEKIRYGNRLDIHIDIPGHTGNLSIAPLLLLPLVENCFKHGTSNMLEQPWLTLEVRIDRNTMNMKLMNGKAPQAKERNHQPGIGIGNVRKRCDLLYAGKYALNITDDTEVFIVDFTIELERKPGITKKLSGNYALVPNE
jgi:LytS/YehU family sensor histidine kinase